MLKKNYFKKRFSWKNTENPRIINKYVLWEIYIILLSKL